MGSTATAPAVENTRRISYSQEDSARLDECIAVVQSLATNAIINPSEYPAQQTFQEILSGCIDLQTARRRGVIE